MTMIFRVSFLLFGLFMFRSAIGQDFQTRYLNGKELIRQGKYPLAMEVLKPLTSEADGNSFVQYAHYYYALAALKAGKPEDGRTMLKHLMLRYPSWEKMQEANYLLSNIYFEQHRYPEALDIIKDVNKDLRHDSENLKLFYLAQIGDIDTLKAIQKAFPDEYAVAQTLAQRLFHFSNNEKDKLLLNYLIDEFSLDRSKLSEKGIRSEKKQAYRIGILMPFMLDKLQTDNVNRPNQFILDLYQGMRLAIDSLQAQGFDVSLHAYDTEKDTNSFKKLLANPEMLGMDLIIGPIFPLHNQILNDFAKKNGIQVVNPISTDHALTVNNPYVFLFQPSLHYQAEQVAMHVRHKLPVVRVDEVEKARGKKDEVKVFADQVVIIYGESDKDSILAHTYKRLITDTIGIPKESAYRVSFFEKLNRSNIGKVKEIFTDSLQMANVSHIFVVSSDQVTAANLISSSEISGFNVPIYTTSEWLDFNLITIEQYERRNVHFIYPDHVDYSKRSVQDFKHGYIVRTRIYPTTFAFQGYEMMMLFGKMLQAYGTYFGTGLMSTGHIPGFNLGGYDYSNAQANRYVPIVKFKDGRLECANVPSNITRK